MAGGFKPYDEYLLTLPVAEQSKKLWALAKKKAASQGKGGKKKVARRRKYKKAYRRNGGKGGGGGIRSGTNIVYPNIVGRGAYGLKGGVSWGRPDSYFRGNLSGYYGDVSGLGAYNVRQNSLMGMIDLGQSPPVVRNTNKGEATVLNHREFLGDLLTGDNTPSLFKLQSFALNPGNGSLFPFLASIAQKFQEYELRGCLIELKTLCSDYAQNMSLGSVFMAADYNTLSIAPVSKQQLENMEYASSSKPSSSMIMPIECDPRNNTATHLYVATNSDYQGGDKRLFDLCNVYIGSQGCPTPDTPIAEIWITYEVALYKPIITEDTLPSAQTISWKLIGQGCNALNPFGATHQVVAGSDTRFIMVGNKIWFPNLPGSNWCITCTWAFETEIAMDLPTLSPEGTLEYLNLVYSSETGNELEGITYGVDASTTATNRYVLQQLYRQSTDETLSPPAWSLATNGNFGIGEAYCNVMIINYSPHLNDGVPFVV